MKVAFTDRARNDLRVIALSIARDSLTRARSFVSELRDKARQIGESPLAFPLYERFEAQGVRRRIFGNYLIFFRIEPDKSSYYAFCMARATWSDFCELI